jgi:hypothetical protein
MLSKNAKAENKENCNRSKMLHKALILLIKFKLQRDLDFNELLCINFHVADSNYDCKFH